MNWEDAKEFCHLSGGRLVTLNTFEFSTVIDFMYKHKLESESWIGGHFQNSTWKWIDGTEILVSSKPIFISLTYNR